MNGQKTVGAKPWRPFKSSWNVKCPLPDRERAGNSLCACTYFSGTNGDPAFLGWRHREALRAQKRVHKNTVNTNTEPGRGGRFRRIQGSLHLYKICKLHGKFLPSYEVHTSSAIFRKLFPWKDARLQLWTILHLFLDSWTFPASTEFLWDSHRPWRISEM